MSSLVIFKGDSKIELLEQFLENKIEQLKRKEVLKTERLQELVDRRNVQALQSKDHRIVLLQELKDKKKEELPLKEERKNVQG